MNTDYISPPVGTPFGGPGLGIDRGQIETNVLQHVKDWIDSYLAVIEFGKQGLEPGILARPKSYDVTTDFTRRPDDSLPFVCVISTGTNAGKPPRQDGEGDVTAYWLVALGCVVSTSDARSAKNLAGYYGKAFRQMMTQMPTLGGWAAGCSWDDERYDDWKRSDDRQMAAVRMVFTVEVPDVVNVYQGFRDLQGGFIRPEDPYTAPESLPVVEQTPTVEIALAKINQSFDDAEE